MLLPQELSPLPVLPSQRWKSDIDSQLTSFDRGIAGIGGGATGRYRVRDVAARFRLDASHALSVGIYIILVIKSGTLRTLEHPDRGTVSSDALDTKRHQIRRFALMQP